VKSRIGTLKLSGLAILSGLALYLWQLSDVPAMPPKTAVAANLSAPKAPIAPRAASSLPD